LFPVAFDIGAIGGRIRRMGWGHVLPLDLLFDPEKLNDALLAIHPTAPPAGLSVAEARYESILRDYYVLDLPLASQSRGIVSGRRP
jgi:hypothetical protein